MIEYGLIFVLLILSFFFAGAETAITTISSPYLYEQRKKGNKRANLLLELKKKSARLLGSLLLGNNVVNIAITALSTSLLVNYFGAHYGVLIATVGVSFIVLVFSEILPKTYALQNTKRFAFRMAPYLYVFVKIFSPVAIGLDWIVKKIMWVFRMKPAPKATEAELKAEIRGTLDMQRQDVMTQEKHMLKSVLDLNDVTVEDVMVHRSQIVSLNADLSIQEIVQFAIHCPHSRIPLWKSKRDNIIGVLHVKALLKAVDAINSGKKTDVEAYLTKPWFVLKSISLLEQLHSFKKRREHFALVVDEYGVLEGVVTLEDILEEIVGDIADESDIPEESYFNIEKTETGAYRVKGSATIRDLNRALKWELSDEDASTLAGYLMYQIERIPEEGQTFVIDGFTFSIVKKVRNKIELIDIIPPAL